MSLHRILIPAALAGALLLPFGAVQAQTKTAKTQGATVPATSVPGVCMLSREAVLGNSKVGKAVNARLKQLVSQAKTQLQNEKTPLDKSIQEFRQKASSMTASTRQSQQKALQQRAQALQQKQQELDARLRITRAKAMQRIGKVVNPIIADAYKQSRCGILLNRDAVLAGNQENDLTAGVIAALNKKMTTLSFDLAPLPQKSSGK